MQRMKCSYTEKQTYSYFLKVEILLHSIVKTKVQLQLEATNTECLREDCQVNYSWEEKAQTGGFDHFSLQNRGFY